MLLYKDWYLRLSGRLCQANRDHEVKIWQAVYGYSLFEMEQRWPFSSDKRMYSPIPLDILRDVLAA